MTEPDTMTEPDAIQRRWARVVGFSYVFALAPAVFAELYVSGRLVSDNAIATAQNIIAHERLFRLGIASNLLVVGQSEEAEVGVACLALVSLAAQFPPGSGQWRTFPEVDKAAFYDLAAAREKINPAQATFLDRLTEALDL